MTRVAKRSDRCLDVGCGIGAGAGIWLATHTAEYLGVDVSEAALSLARTAGLTVQHIEDAAKLPFADASFDLAVCVEVFEHLFEPQLAAAEMLRVLRPGGRLFATTPNVAYWRRRADLALFGRWNPLGDNESLRRPWRDPHLRFFGCGSLRRMLVEQGFQDVVVAGHGLSWMVDVPGVRRLMRTELAGPLYGLLVRILPSLFGQSLHAVAVKAGNDKS